MLHLLPCDTFFFFPLEAADDDAVDDFFWMLADFLLKTITSYAGISVYVENTIVFGPVSYLDTSHVRYFLWPMFPMDFKEDISRWDVSNVVSMDNLFNGCEEFNQPLAGWNVSKVRNMSRMFQGASSFNQPLETWDVRNVTDMSSMFYNATQFNQPLKTWRIALLHCNICSMFANALAFNQPESTPPSIQWLVEN
jgi:surface protein